MFRGKPQVHLALCLLFFFFKKDFFKILFFKIYLSVPGLSCSLQDLPLQHVVSSSPTFLQTWARKRAEFSEPETVQKHPWLYFSLVVFMDTEIGISQNLHVLQNIILFDCSQTLGNAKTAKQQQNGKKPTFITLALYISKQQARFGPRAI